MTCGILFRLGDAKLGKTRAADDFAEDIGQRLRRKNHRAAVGLVVFGQRDKVHCGSNFAIKALKILVQKGNRQLARPIGAKIEPDDDVAVADALLIVHRRK